MIFWTFGILQIFFIRTLFFENMVTLGEDISRLAKQRYTRTQEATNAPHIIQLKESGVLISEEICRVSRYQKYDVGELTWKRKATHEYATYVQGHYLMNYSHL